MGDFYLCSGTASEQNLIEFKKRFVYVENIIIFVKDEIADYHVKSIAFGKCESCRGQQFLCFDYIQAQSDGECYRCLLGRAVVLIAFEFGENAFVNVGSFVALNVGHSAFVY